MTLAEALQQAQANAAERQDSGFDQAALDEAARQGLKNGAFEESADEGAEVMEEFYPNEEPGADATNGEETPPPESTGLGGKLAERAERMPDEREESL